MRESLAEMTFDGNSQALRAVNCPKQNLSGQLKLLYECERRFKNQEES